MVEQDPSRDIGFYDKTLGAMTRLIYQKMVRPILQIEDTPRSIAMGITLGLFVGLTPTVGIQMVIVIVLGTLLSANRLAAVCVVWISNVFTVVPFYYLFYVTGVFILGRESMTYEELAAIVSLDTDRTAWQTVVYIFEELGWPLWLGSLIIATAVSVPAYPYFYKLFKRRAIQKKSSDSSDAPLAEDSRGS